MEHTNMEPMFSKKAYRAELEKNNDYERFRSAVINFANASEESKESKRTRMKEVGDDIKNKLMEKFGKKHKVGIKMYVHELAQKFYMDSINIKETEVKNRIVKSINEQLNERYMFFSNLEQIQRQCKLLLDLEESMVESILENGHDWAQDHVATAKESLDQVFDFIMNETKKGNADMNVSVMEEGKKKAGTKLCSRGKAAAKAKFKVYPSAYANGYAVQVCKGRMPGTDGKKHCSPPYC